MKLIFFQLAGVLFLISLIFHPFRSKAQSLVPISSRSLTDIQGVSLDRNHYIYISHANGNILQLNSSGETSLKYSPAKKAAISLIDAWQTMRIFIFFRDLQQFQFLDRFLNSSTYFDLDSKEIGYASIATPTHDNNLWIVDESDFTLKKYHVAMGKVVIQSPLNLVVDDIARIGYMREYQNLLFINNGGSSVLVFDNLGNFMRAIPDVKASYFNFLDDEMYMLEDNSIRFINIYTGAERNLAIPNQERYLYALVLNGHIALLTEKKLDIMAIRN